MLPRLPVTKGRLCLYRLKLLHGCFFLAAAIHNTEEAPWLPRWSSHAGRWHASVKAGAFRFAVLILTALALGIVILARMQGPQSAGAYLLTGYALAMGLNVAFPHLAATIVMRRYMPGTATALVLNLPVTTLLIAVALRDGIMSPGLFLIAGPLVTAAIVLSIPVLFYVGGRLTERK